MKRLEPRLVPPPPPASFLHISIKETIPHTPGLEQLRNGVLRVALWHASSEHMKILRFERSKEGFRKLIAGDITEIASREQLILEP